MKAESRTRRIRKRRAERAHRVLVSAKAIVEWRGRGEDDYAVLAVIRRDAENSSVGRDAPGDEAVADVERLVRPRSIEHVAHARGA